MDRDGLLKLSRDCGYVRTASSVIICIVACYLFHACIGSDGGGDADSVLYNGQNTNGEIVKTLYCVDEAQYGENYYPPIYCPNGLYVAIGTNVTEITVHYLPL